MPELLPIGLREPIRQVFAIVDGLRARFLGRRFTPGDMLIGDTGEVLAETYFDLEGIGGNSKSHDFRCRLTGELVQVKTTSGNRVGLGRTKEEFQRLLVFKIYSDGTFDILYNGPGRPVWEVGQHNKSNSISVRQLRELQPADEAAQLKRVRDPELHD
jgi:hypothetical protein